MVSVANCFSERVSSIGPVTVISRTELHTLGPTTVASLARSSETQPEIGRSDCRLAWSPKPHYLFR